MKAITKALFDSIPSIVERAEAIENKAKEKDIRCQSYVIITCNERSTFTMDLGGEHYFCHIGEDLTIENIFADAEKYIDNADALKKARIEALRKELAELEGNE